MPRKVPSSGHPVWGYVAIWLVLMSLLVPLLSATEAEYFRALSANPYHPNSMANLWFESALIG